MGGKGSGGDRVGSGRKSKGEAAHWLGGNAGKRRPKGQGRPEAPGRSLDLIPAPADLLEDQREVWETLAPHACAARTLTVGTIAAFRDLCEAITMKRSLYDQIVADGFVCGKTIRNEEGDVVAVEKKAHPLLGHHRGMMQRVEAGMLRFRLSPMGKELTPADPPKDEWDEFDQPTVQ